MVASSVNNGNACSLDFYDQFGKLLQRHVIPYVPFYFSWSPDGTMLTFLCGARNTLLLCFVDTAHPENGVIEIGTVCNPIRSSK